MKFTKLFLILMVLFIDALAQTDMQANISATNNYVWRGMTQTNNQTAIQGGVDVNMGVLYVGAWTSNVLDDTEIDGYVGMKGVLSERLEYDIGFIRYGYLKGSKHNFNETYVALREKLTYGKFGIKYSKGMDTAPNDLALDLSLILPKHYFLDLGWGDYDTVGKRYSIGLSTSLKNINFSALYSKNNFDVSKKEDEKNIVLSIGMTF